ncbi:hypothetical protein, partial [Algoriphagus antarcticus]|uniref:hypothetical protein n=1 Tax=Algoriphagus antarcticus TaxID=238540 RepID=UPI001B878741
GVTPGRVGRRLIYYKAFQETERLFGFIDFLATYPSPIRAATDSNREPALLFYSIFRKLKGFLVL